MNFVYQNLHSTKKVHEKNDFSQITHMWSDIDFMDFWKKSIFFEIFCSNLHLKKNVFFCRFFLKFFLQKGSEYYGDKVFLTFFDFVWKMCYQSKEKYFFFVFKKKTSNWTPVWGGKSFSSFFKINFLDY